MARQHLLYATDLVAWADDLVHGLSLSIRLLLVNLKLAELPPPGRGHPWRLAGRPKPGYQDGHGATARFSYPTGLCVTPDSTVYVANIGAA